MTPTDGLHDPVEIAIKRYSSHPSIKLISENRNPSHNFVFSFVTNSRVSAKLRELKVNKAPPIGSIPCKTLKENSDIFIGILQQLLNVSIADGAFPFELKRGEKTSVFKANDQVTKGNYRPITVLSAISKVYERLLSEQIVAYSESFLFQYLCGFREGCSTQQALVRFLEKCKSVLDRKEVSGAILMDLSKAFDCLNHELLIAKLSACGFSRSALKLIHSDSNERQQQVKVNGAFSISKQTSLGVP